MVKKIIMIAPFPPPYGGVAICAENLINSNYLRNKYNIIPLKEKPISMHHNNIFTKIQRMAMDILHLLKISIFQKPDMVHIHTSYDGGWPKHSIYLLISKLFGKTIILHLHAIDRSCLDKFPISWKKKYIFPPRFILNFADAIIVLSDQLKSQLSSICDNEIIFTIPNGIYQNRFLNQEKDVRLLEKKPNESIKILFLGGLERRKGIYELLEAIPKLIEKNKKIHFLIAGRGPAKTDIENFSSDPKYKSNVHFLGEVTEEVKIQLFIQSDIFLLQSYNEGLPITILEAMGSGLPIISTPICAIPNVVENGKNGFLIESGNVDQLTSIVLKLSDDEMLRARIGKANIEKISQNYDMEVIARKIEVVYREVIK